MSRLDDLIAELCPNGVEFKHLGDVCLNTANISWAANENKTFRYIDLTSVDRETHSIVDTTVINSGNAPSRAQKVVKADDVIFGTTRPTLKRYCFISTDYDDQICSTGYCVLRADKAQVAPRYIYHLISTTKFDTYVKANQRGSAYPAISDTDVKGYTIPVPPLPIQQEIVRILDKFTALEAELEAELEAREKQYEYYRNALLSFGDDVPLVALGDVCSIGDGLHGTPQYSDNGIYYFINGNNLCNGQISIDSKTKRVDEDSYKKHGIQFTDKTIFMSINGTIGNMSFYNNENVVLGKSVAYFNIESYFLFPRYLYYYLQTDYSQNYYKNQLTGSTIQNLGLKALRKYKIPLPPLEEQERIVAILESFDALANDITTGLPAEIEARRKQYEYYRDKLLTFKEAVS